MKILMAGSELTPLAKTGGLGDVLAALPREIMKLGHEVCVVLPYYRSVREARGLRPKPAGITIPIQIGQKTCEAEVLETTRKGGPQLFFIRQDAYFDRTALYGEGGDAYADNAERFIFFSKAVVELARRMRPAPEILHVHDWQAALVPVLARAQGLPFRTVLTIHNLAYQGGFGPQEFAWTNLPGRHFSPQSLEFYGNLNLLKGGILAADVLTTVSDSYKRDILTPEFGCGLDAVLREHAGKLFGFLNGADYSTWNPSTDKLLPKTYRPSAMRGKRTCRAELLGAMGLAPGPRGPVFAMVSRLADQKGFDILLPVLDRLLGDDVRLVVLGEGDAHTAADLALATRRYPDKFAFRQTHDESLAHLIEAGSDISLIPSRFEPCGLSAIYGLKYGALPVARATGGLYEIIRDVADDGWGFLFHDHTPEAFWDTIVRAKRLFAREADWAAVVKRAMRLDFSWKRTAHAYEAIYAQCLRAS